VACCRAACRRPAHRQVDFSNSVRSRGTSSVGPACSYPEGRFGCIFHCTCAGGWGMSPTTGTAYREQPHDPEELPVELARCTLTASSGTAKLSEADWLRRGISTCSISGSAVTLNQAGPLPHRRQPGRQREVPARPPGSAGNRSTAFSPVMARPVPTTPVSTTAIPIAP
jgi:hypothetical protein